MARLIPTGECWCGCGSEAALGSFFKPGHDKVAESAVINIEYGGVAEFRAAHHLGPSEGRRASSASATKSLVEIAPAPPSRQKAAAPVARPMTPTK